MIGVRVVIGRYVDDAQPGWVECRLVDLRGEVHCFVEKVPVVTAEDLDAVSAYPREGVIACEVLERRVDAAGREVAVIDTERPWHVPSTSGQTRFEVGAEELVEIDEA